MFVNRDKRRFSQWIDAHHQRLYRHALWMIGNPDLAADLVQETYYQAWKSRKQLRDPERVLPWLLTILRRNVFNNGPAFSGDVDIDALEIAAADTGHDDLLDLSRGLQRLRPADRDLLLLFALHGFSYQEIGDHLDIPVGTVMSRLSRSRAALRGQMDRPEARVLTLVPSRKRELNA